MINDITDNIELCFIVIFSLMLNIKLLGAIRYKKRMR